ncbi:MAG: DUF86 domain-containing protein [Alphaproteobacteria bacterium]|nr:DUF86 domain-containing protein [Alphaproteobacteria bacterium]
MKRTFDDDDYLQHIEDAIAKIDRYMTGKSDADFLSDEVIQDAIIRNLEVIGEAVSKLSEGLKKGNPDVAWIGISGMRNRLIHGYFNVNLKTVLDTIRVTLPVFLARIRSLRRKSG